MDEATILPASNFSEVVLSLLLIVASIVAIGWLFRLTRGMRGPRGQIIKIIASQPLGSRERVVLVNIADKRLVLGVTASQIQTLLVIDESDVDLSPQEAPASGGFSARLRQALGGMSQ